jgi:hypothetical protein
MKESHVEVNLHFEVGQTSVDPVKDQLRLLIVLRETISERPSFDGNSGQVFGLNIESARRIRRSIVVVKNLAGVCEGGRLRSKISAELAA